MNIACNDKRIEDILFKYCLSLKPCGKARVGAILTYKNNIIAFGHNQYKTHPLQARYGRNERSIFLHAEINCIVNAIRSNSKFSYLSKSILYIGRYKHYNMEDSGFGLAKPCIGCQRAITAFGIREVWYSGGDQCLHQL